MTGPRRTAAGARRSAGGQAAAGQAGAGGQAAAGQARAGAPGGQAAAGQAGAGEVAGVDGCRAGWVVARGPIDAPGPVSVQVHPALEELLAEVRAGRVAAVAVDIPIGLPDAGGRRCDTEVRRMLGPRRSSVFPAPRRAVLGAGDWAEANARSRAIDGVGLPRQTYGLLPRIAEVDRLIDPELQDRVAECHPELAFCLLAGAPMQHPKRTPSGQTERRAALARAAIDYDEGRRPGAGVDDVLDAVVLWWSARRLHLGCRLRTGGQRDGRGLRMEISA